MTRRRRLALLSLGCLLLTLHANAQDKSDVRPDKLYRLDVRARKPDEKEFTPFSKKLAIQVFRDRQAGRLFYVAEEGKVLAVVTATKDAARHGDNAPTLLHRFLLPVRAWEEKTFTERTPKVGVELYRDENNGNLVYVSHSGSVAVVAGMKVAADKAGKAPKWLDRLPLKVRRAGYDFPLELLHCNVEIYRDEDTGGLVYVADSGAIAVVSLKKSGESKQTREPDWSHAMEFRTRAFGEANFTARTALLGAEVYRDAPRDAWIYVTESLRLAVTPIGRAFDALKEKTAAPRWEGRVWPRVTTGGGWSAEVYFNPNTRDRLFVSSGGALAALPSP